jgi:hypothetical protein
MGRSLSSGALPASETARHAIPSAGTRRPSRSTSR